MADTRPPSEPLPDESDVALARRVAVEAADLLMRLRAEAGGGLDEAGRRALGDLGDRVSNELILRHLAAQRPGDAVLSEEAADDLVRLASSRVWIVDPLDGTAEYRTERDEFAVHVALWDDGQLACGVIALPDRGRVWSTDDAAGPPPELDLDGEVLIAVSRSRSHIPPEVHAVVDRLGRALSEAGHAGTVGLSHVGSVGAKTDEVLIGRAAAYVYSGGLKEWDAAAPFAVAERRGFTVLAADGRPPRYNQRIPVLGSGYLVHPSLAALMRAAVEGSGL